MKALDFFSKHNIHAHAAILGEHDQHYPATTGSSASEHERLTWGLFLRINNATSPGQRVLALTAETGVSDAELPWNELLPLFVSEANDGTMSFEQYVDEGYGDGLIALEQYQGWIALVAHRHRVEQWLGENSAMRADFYRVSESDEDES